MAGTSLLTLIDDIATLLDDVAVMSKVAAKKTAGVLGDDLALNAEQVTGVKADRELPVVWAVAKGAFVNKLILVPAALLISAFIPWLITPLLMLGGLFLCYEGVEKILHSSQGPDEVEHQARIKALNDPNVDMLEFEKQKVKGAIRTDFILSAEIIVITLGTVAAAALTTQIVVLSVIALGMVVVVYGLVAGIVRLDDLGLYLQQLKGRGIKGVLRGLGAGIVAFAPWLMKALSIVGTAAMFIVGGGILTHSIPGAHDLIHHWVEAVVQWMPALGGMIKILMPTLVDTLFGIIAGVVAVFVIGLVMRLLGKKRTVH